MEPMKYQVMFGMDAACSGIEIEADRHVWKDGKLTFSRVFPYVKSDKPTVIAGKEDGIYTVPPGAEMAAVSFTVAEFMGDKILGFTVEVPKAEL